MSKSRVTWDRLLHFFIFLCRNIINEINFFHFYSFYVIKIILTCGVQLTNFRLFVSCVFALIIRWRLNFYFQCWNYWRWLKVSGLSLTLWCKLYLKLVIWGFSSSFSSLFLPLLEWNCLVDWVSDDYSFFIILRR